MDAWEVLTQNSSAPISADMWTHLNSQISEGSGDVYYVNPLQISEIEFATVDLEVTFTSLDTEAEFTALAEVTVDITETNLDIEIEHNELFIE